MATIENSIFINRPPQEVWDFFSNPANNPQWSTVEFCEWTSAGPPAVGSTQREVGKILGRKIESTSEITAWEPPYELGRKSVGGPIPVETTFKIESKENGTQLNARIQAEVGGLFKIAEGLLARQVQKQLDTSFEALKHRLEAGEV